MSNQWKEICALNDIPRLGSRRVRRADGTDIAIFRTSTDAVFALLDQCPHKGGPLSEGIVFGEKVACPLHNWAISLASGEATAPDEGCAQRFAVKLEGAQVWLDADNPLAPHSASAAPTAHAAHAAHG